MLGGRNSARIAVSHLLARLDYNTLFIIPYKIGKKQLIIFTLIDTGATKGNFINVKEV